MGLLAMMVYSVVPIVTQIDMTGIGAVKKSDLRRAQKRAYFHIGQFWLANMLPKHFESGAKSTYNYRPRSAKYLRRKRAAVHHSQPLVFTKDLMNQVQRPANQRVSATSKGASVRLRHHIVTRQVRQEMTTITSAESKKLSEEYRDHLIADLNSVKRRKRIRLKR
jgi:hypothetical protein